MSHRLRAGLLVSGVLMLGPLVLGPSGTAAASGQVCMGVVVDDGGGSATVQEVNVAPGTSDLQALPAAGDTVTQNSSGLVCAINGFPSNGLQNCLAASGGLYYYWSYWQGDPLTNTWTYGEVGPASHTVSAGQTYVEGWRYQDPGPDNAGATKPAVTPAAAFGQACPGVTPVSSGSGGGGGGSGNGAGGSGGGGGVSTGGGTPSSGAAVSSPTTTTPASPSPGAGGNPVTGATTRGGHTTTGKGVTTSTRPGSRPGSRTGSSRGASPTTAPTTTAHGATSQPRNAKGALASSTVRGSAGGGDPLLPIVVVAVVIAALGALAWWRWRRRPIEP